MNKIRNEFWLELIHLLNDNWNIISENIMTDLVYKIYKKHYKNNISIEISKSNNKIEILFCWGHSKENINFIEKLLLDKPKIDWYIFIWPKPEYWFDFEINMNNNLIEAKNLLFFPLKSDSNRKKLWISIYLKDKIDNELLWKIIETWIWEKKASQIEYLLLNNDYDDDYLPINMLGDYINWFLENKS